MLYQAQGAVFTNLTDTSNYGAFALGNSGHYEIYEVISVSANDVLVAENGTLCNNNSLIYSYDATRTQVIRMPQFENLTIETGSSILTPAWTGVIGGVIALDNVLWGGRVADASDQTVQTLALRDLNQQLHEDLRIELTMLSIGDGLTLARQL